jgi:uncharacterized protein involved in type VI secretion and phage assembly
MEIDNLKTVSQNFATESNAYKSTFSVYFPKTPNFELLLVAAEFTQEVEAHDVLVLTFKGKSYNPETALASMDPVIFTYTAGADTAKFEGYVYDIDPSTTTQKQMTTVICGGASIVMKDSAQKIYKKVSADQVLTKICNKHGLKAVTQKHPRIKETIVQAGQTDWQMLKRLAKQTGFALKTNNTSIIFMSKNKIFEDKKSGAPYFFYQTGITKQQRSTGTCLAFNPSISDDSIERGSRVDRVLNASDTSSTVHLNKSFDTPSRGIVVPNDSYFNSLYQ